MRLLSLDVLRGIAVLLVIVRHCDAAWGAWLAPIRRGGWVGVDLFFVLSGFLVSGLLFREFEREGSIKPVRFLVRRGWKIYPAFWALIAVMNLGRFDFSRTLAELAFVQSYVEHRWCEHTWSLAVEEHFYLLLPFFLLTLSKDRFAALPRIVFAIMAGLLLARCVNGLRPFSYQTHLFPTHLRLDGLFFGVLLAYWRHSWPEFNVWGKNNAKGLIALGVVLLIPAFVLNVEMVPALYTYWLTAQTLGCGAILTGLVCGGIPENLFTKGLGKVGTYSYSIYLWHVPVIVVVSPALGFESVWLIVGCCIGLGAAMSRLIESPFLWLRERMTPAPYTAALA
ncbi:MAG TPA: acyltransferase [Pirellulales bacterium]|nr:acyltransferase [Pirellulales bacterium]